MGRDKQNGIAGNLFEGQRLFLRVVCLLAIAMLFATRPLWFSDNQFPAIGILNGLSVSPGVERVVGWLLLATIGWVLLFTAKDHQRQAGVLVVVGLSVVLVVLNQHRLQPWLIHVNLLLIILCARRFEAIRWVTIGIYFHSAASKLDHSFLTEGGHYLVEAIVACIGLSTVDWPGSAKLLACTALPVFELLIAALLVYRRKNGWVLAILMHMGLIAALLQLGHQPGVILWNGVFIVQAIAFLLHAHSSKPKSKPNLAPGVIGIPCMMLACLVPFANYEPIDIWDNWPSWSLYSTRNERIRVFVQEYARAELPSAVLPFVDAPNGLGHCQIKIDRWSLHETSAPIYPEDRFQIGVALELASEMTSSDGIIVRVASKSDRINGERTTTTLIGRKQIQAYLDRFWLNAVSAKVPVK